MGKRQIRYFMHRLNGSELGPEPCIDEVEVFGYLGSQGGRRGIIEVAKRAVDAVAGIWLQFVQDFQQLVGTIDHDHRMRLIDGVPCGCGDRQSTRQALDQWWGSERCRKLHLVGRDVSEVELVGAELLQLVGVATSCGMVMVAVQMGADLLNLLGRAGEPLFFEVCQKTTLDRFAVFGRGGDVMDL